MKTFKIVEFFSGIGSQARALENIGININVQATCEWDIHAFVAYDAIHKSTSVLESVLPLTRDALIKELSKYTLSLDGKGAMNDKTLNGFSEEILKRILSAIIRTNNLVDISKISGKQMPSNTDLLTYSFPCQDLSNVGAFHGYNKGIDKNSGSRSSLLWQVGRILKEMSIERKKLPRYLVMENVPTLLSERHFHNFNEWIKELEKLGYINKYIPVNARNYGIPQNRPRLLMISAYVGEDHDLKNKLLKLFEKWGNDEEYIVNEYRKSKYFHEIKIKDLIRIDNNSGSKLWNEAVSCTPNDTISRKKIWNENPKILDEHGNLTKVKFIRTLTTKQDRHPNSGNLYFDSGIEGKSKFRYLTPRECLLFMGFTDKDYDKLQENNPPHGQTTLFPRDKIIRMAGNSIPVKMLEGFFFQLYALEEVFRQNQKN